MDTVFKDCTVTTVQSAHVHVLRIQRLILKAEDIADISIVILASNSGIGPAKVTAKGRPRG